MRILLTISYDGTNFLGYQVQPGKRTVQLVLEEALFKLTGVETQTVASGRTDSGVHAKCQKVHFDSQLNIPVENYSKALNTFLPEDVKVIKSERVDDDFNARFTAKKKTYSYSVYISDIELPLFCRYAQNIKYTIDMELIKKAASIFVGEHDFKCLLSSGSSVKTTVRTIYNIDIKEENGLIKFYVTGNGFLYNMVRILIGTILDVGSGKKTLESVLMGLESQDRTKMGKTMPAKGLCLENVEY